MRAAAPPAITTAQVSVGFRRLVQPLLPWLTALLILLALLKFQDSASQAIALIAFSGPMLFAVALWCQRSGPCLPVLPLVLFTTWLVFGLALLQVDSAQLPDPLLDLVVPNLLFWPLSLLLGWFLVPSVWLRRPPQPSLLGVGEGQRYLPHLLIAAALLLQWLIGSPLFWELLGSASLSLLNPLQTLITLLTLPGGFIGAFRSCRGRLQEEPLFWSLVVVFFFTYLLSFLLSSAQNLVLAVLLGLWIGRSPKALPITLALVLILTFLHPGKFVMRAKYWGTGIPTPSPPELLLEWVSSSYDQLFLPQAAVDGQSLSRRLTNLGMLLYVNVQLASGTPALDGASYALIPQVLVPRVLNPDKVRSQEGQVLLNLHYGRQRSRAETERTYISWGLLPEAVGNFGPLFGPVVVGLLFGAAIRLVELLGSNQDLLSKPGLESLVLMVLTMGSYEMVASTFVAAAFQIVILIELLTWFLVQRQAGKRFSP